jgi:HAD superfamily hydrolase (TIGR01509 family)
MTQPARGVDGLDLVIFDMDGVLVDTTPCHARAYEALWREIGVPGPPYEAIAGQRTGDVVAARTTALQPTRDQLDAWVRFKQARARECIATEQIIFADSEPALERLVRRNIRLALGTSGSRDTTAIVLQRLRGAQHFVVVVTAEDVTEGKPSAQVYSRVMERANARPEQTLIVEDSASGLLAAAESRARIASVRTGRSLDHPNFVGSFADLDDLVTALDSAA